MPRKRQGPNRSWSKEEKLRIINKVINEDKSLKQVSEEEDISKGMLGNWVRKYLKFGEQALINKKKPGNIIKKRIPNERRWYSCKIHEVTQIKYEIIEFLSKEYNIKSLCSVLKVSSSGYYKWLKNKDTLNNYELNRKHLGQLIEDVHKRKPSYGYHRIRKIILDETGWVVSDNLVHKVCKLLNIKSKAKHYKYKRPGEESIKYENIIRGNWNASRPFEIIVSDTTLLKNSIISYLI